MRLSDVLSKTPSEQFVQVEGFLAGRSLPLGKQRKINVGKVALPFFCKRCEDNHTFCSGNELFCIRVSKSSVSIDCVLTCPRCNNSIVPTWFLVVSDNDIAVLGPNVRIQKRSHRLFETVLPHAERFSHFSEYLYKAKQAHSEGLGAGSIVYLRKILEIITTQAASTAGIERENAKGKRKTFKDFLQEVDRACSIIPREFSQNGYRLFGELSDVLHAEYDEALGLRKYEALCRLVVGVIDNVNNNQEILTAINALGWNNEGEAV
jgi:hypothetical protein